MFQQRVKRKTWRNNPRDIEILSEARGIQTASQRCFKREVLTHDVRLNGKSNSGRSRWNYDYSMERTKARFKRKVWTQKADRSWWKIRGQRSVRARHSQIPSRIGGFFSTAKLNCQRFLAIADISLQGADCLTRSAWFYFGPVPLRVALWRKISVTFIVFLPRTRAVSSFSFFSQTVNTSLLSGIMFVFSAPLKTGN